MGLLSTFQISFCISNLGMRQELIFIYNQMREGDGDLRSCSSFNGKFVSLVFGYTRRWLIWFHLGCSESHFVAAESILREES
jgi:hypothetical protein